MCAVLLFVCLSHPGDQPGHGPVAWPILSCPCVHLVKVPFFLSILVFFSLLCFLTPPWTRPVQRSCDRIPKTSPSFDGLEYFDIQQIFPFSILFVSLCCSIIWFRLGPVATTGCVGSTCFRYHSSPCLVFCLDWSRRLMRSICILHLGLQ